jgi:hypothetical protein
MEGKSGLAIGVVNGGSRDSDRRSLKMQIMRFRVKETFTATLVATRRRERFVPGELLILVEGSESPAEARFIRLNGLRSSRGLECRYSIGSDELREKTEAAGPPTNCTAP